MLNTTLSHYRITAELGAGGMGVVYRARDERLDRDVAIKVLPEEVAQDEERLARFEREAKLLASLSHQNIAHLYGLESVERTVGEGFTPSRETVSSGSGSSARPQDLGPTGPITFLVMELAEGETLAERIERAPIPIDDALDYARQIAEGLEAAHKQGIIHRDLKPANVMLSPEGELKILDFGLAKAFEPPGSEPSSAESIAESPTMTAGMTRTGVLLGTAAYMSPEQARGKAVDKRTDVWAFGCVLYEMLTGQKAFQGNDASQVMAAILRDDPDWDALPPATPNHIRRLLARCLVKNPRDRLHDIADARIELRFMSADGYTQDEPVAYASSPNDRRTWLPWGVVAVLSAALIATIATGVRSSRTPSLVKDVVRASIELPEGISLAHLRYGHWVGPMRNELALSPEGRILVFSAATEERHTNAQLFRRTMDREHIDVIPGTDGASSPFFSPDGQWVAFWADGKLKKTSLDGGLPITLATYRDPSGPYPFMGGDWGLDDNIIIGTHTNGLQTVAADGGQFENLTIPERSTEYAHRMPQILPSGRAVLFTVSYDYLGSGGHIEVLSLETGERHMVVESGLDGRYVPTGHLLFLREGTLMAAPFDPDQFKLTGNPVPVLEGVMQATNIPAGWANSGAGVFSVSKNGTLIFAAGSIAPDPFQRLVWVDRHGKIEPVAALSAGDISGPRISPDGRLVAFSTCGLDSSVWVHDIERETTSKLTNDGRVNWSSWSPDGDRLVIGRSIGGNANLYEMTTRGDWPLERLTTSECLQQPGSWTPDGRYLAFVQWVPFGGIEIWLLDLDSSEAEPFLQSDHADFLFPDFSPDGRWLAYSSDESGSPETWITSFPGRERRLLVSKNNGRAPLWSPDGRELFYRSGDRLMAVEVDTESDQVLGRPKLLFEARLTTSGPLRAYDIMPDGSRFIFTEDMQLSPKDPPSRKLEVVLNWFEELNRLVPTK